MRSTAFRLTSLSSPRCARGRFSRLLQSWHDRIVPVSKVQYLSVGVYPYTCWATTRHPPWQGKSHPKRRRQMPVKPLPRPHRFHGLRSVCPIHAGARVVWTYPGNRGAMPLDHAPQFTWVIYNSGAGGPAASEQQCRQVAKCRSRFERSDHTWKIVSISCSTLRSRSSNT